MVFKLYVDSRFRVDNNGSDTNFAIELPHPIQVKGRAYVDCCLIPNTFEVIRQGENDRVFLAETVGTPSVTHYLIATIAHGQYSAYGVAAAMATALNAVTQQAGQYTVTYNPLSARLDITNSSTTDW